MSYDEEYQDEIDDVELRDFWSEQLQRAPWWLISIVFHAILALLTTLAVIASKKAEVKDSYPVEVYTVEKKEVVLKPKIREEKIKDTKPVPTDEPVIEDPVVKEVEISDHHETDSNEDQETAKGEVQAAANSPFKSVFDNSNIGAGGGGGGYFGQRIGGGRRNLVKRGGGSDLTESAVKAGLEWLKRHQSSDGRWDTDTYTSQCGKNPKFQGFCEGAGYRDYDPAMTGFALLCFLASGSSTSEGDYKEQVKKGIQFLKQQQDPEGCIGTRGTEHHMYNHAIGTFALVEAYAMSNYNPLLKIPAQKAVDFLLKAQNPGQGWRYTFAKGEDDTSVMGWCVTALRSAKEAKLSVPDSSFEGATAFLNKITPADQGYRAAYREREDGLEFEGTVIDDDELFSIDLKNAEELDKGNVPRELADKLKQLGKPLGYNATVEKTTVTNIDMALGSSRKKGTNDAWIVKDVVSSERQEFLLQKMPDRIKSDQINEKYAASESMTAVGMNARVFMAITDDDDIYVETGAQRLSQNPPVWGRDQQGYSLINYYYWYHGTLAMFQKGEPYWEEWNQKMVDVFVRHQVKGGCQDGSWPAVGKRCRVNSRVYATALSIMSLQIYYRYPKSFGNRVK
ncbi:prenyltransferase/squalene oxidase repeat-containing protein [Candidatus Uabimicrobium sp. HlEnr_7]|uniref:prenyltransferase/squalene oxidase repeat-containing protein n=1 Tax=Candidatus Uabimicrobium helgolandensis TaxID=3095367 RepID=UPI00355740FF